MDGKKTDAVTVKLSAEMHRFVEVRSAQMGYESPGEYIRALIESDHGKAFSDFKLLSLVLGIKENGGNSGNHA